MQGLSQTDLDERKSIYGQNDILLSASSGWNDVIRDTFRDPMVWFLVSISSLFFWMGNYSDGIVLGVALLPIIGMDAYLHRRTQASTEGLKGQLSTLVKVYRDGAIKVIPALDLLPGDLALVSAGESFPADGIILKGENIQVDESALTGESMPVRKRFFTVPFVGTDSTSIDEVHWGTAGTRLLTGDVTVRIIFTGADTLYGQIARSARSEKHERTPLQNAIARMIGILIVIATILCLLLATIRYQQGYGVLDALLSALTLAIAALPEEFPVVFTFFLGVGVFRLAKRRALVRRAVVVENIGRISCICTDKTGTLTMGKLELSHIVSNKGLNDEFVVNIASFASRKENGDPLDALLLEKATVRNIERIETYPFTEDRRRETAIIKNASGEMMAVIKGAPETIISMVECDDKARENWLDKTRTFATNGHKVIACAYKKLDIVPADEPENDYQLAGLLAFEDPLRDGVAVAVKRAQAAGIRVIMVTGDHPATAAAIAKDLGIGSGDPHVIEGPEIDFYLNNGSKDTYFVDVIARAKPSDKLKIVRALQKAGHIVAVTGDGVNDVPALQGADVGIAMGERGTRPAREVASIVLLDDNFRTIVRAIAEGRQLFQNLKLSFFYLLMIHLPFVATAAIIPLLGYPLLYLPIHIVWLELIIHPTALLVYQQLPATDDLDILRNNVKVRFFDWNEWIIIGLVGTLITLLIIFLYEQALGAEQNVIHARTIALAALIISGATITLILSGFRSNAARMITGLTLLSAVLLIQFPALSDLMHLSPLHLQDWIKAAIGGIFAASFAGFIKVKKNEKKQPFKMAVSSND
ncbi:MAG: cation-transporting P-type ATPase [Alphaproteobacteria bacterium]|nr:cation-transporting P-type ATPase [Alphaproteobacteria bacterium]